MTSGNAKTVVVIKGSSIGDIITGIPMLRNVRKNFPSARIILVSSYRANGEPIVKACPYIDEYVVIDSKDDGFLKNLEKIRYIRGKTPDIVINGFPTTLKSSFLAFLTGGRLKAGIKSRKKPMIPFFFNVVAESGGKDAVEAEDELIRRVGMKSSGTELELFFDLEKAGKTAAAKMKKHGIKKGDKIIGFYFGKNVDICRSWVNEKWAELINLLSRRYRLKFVFVGGNDSLQRGNYIEKICSAKICNLIGKLSIEETAAIARRCSVFITTNGGPMQIAAAVGTPLVALHGSSLPEWYPHSEKSINLRNSNICTYPCGNDSYCQKCKGRSIKDIKVECVLSAAAKLLKLYSETRKETGHASDFTIRNPRKLYPKSFLG